MSQAGYPYGRYLLLAGSLSVVGQLTGYLFAINPNPYTTILFMAVGTVLIALGIALFGLVICWEIKARVESVTERSFHRGDLVFRQGDPGDCVYVVKSGEVEVLREDPEKGERVIARLGPEEYFGERALLTDAPRSATVRCASDVTVLFISRQNFLFLYSSIPDLRTSIESVMRRRG